MCVCGGGGGGAFFRPNKEYVCFRLHVLKIRVGRYDHFLKNNFICLNYFL